MRFSVRRLTVAAVILWGSSLREPSPSMAASATEQLRETVEPVVAILKNSPLNSEADAAAFRTNMIRAISPRFDFAEMAKRSLGSRWEKRTVEEQREFVKILAGFLGRSYVGNLQS
jgi:phospholipid transport system substrate-binding protein